MGAHDVATKNALAKRDLSIDSLRGVAILLMVAGHVVGSTGDRGLGVADDSLWRYSYIGLEDIRMPLFAVLSGFVYAGRPVAGPRVISSFARGKARRLILPLVTVGTLFFFTQLIVPGTNSKPELADLWKIYVYGHEYLWFVQAMFLIFILVAILDAFGFLNSIKTWVIAGGFASLLFVFTHIPSEYDVFSAAGAIRLIPFFFIGYGFKKFGEVIETRFVLTVCAVAFVGIYAVRIGTIVTDYSGSNPSMRLLQIAVGLCAVTVLMALRRHLTCPALARVGRYSFSIYLLHVFGSAGSRIMLTRIGIEEQWIVFLASMIVAVGMPILFERTLGRVGWVGWALLGKRFEVRSV